MRKCKPKPESHAETKRRDGFLWITPAALRHFLLIFPIFSISLYAQPAAPGFDPESSDGVRDFSVEITGPGTIRYTTHGMDPTDADQTIGSGSFVDIKTNLTLKARSWESGVPSDVTSATYRVTGMVAAGSQHALLVRSSGEVWSWGLGSMGRLGNGGTTNQHNPVRVAKNAGNFDNAIFAAAGYQHSLLVDEEGFVWAFGNGANGRLGNNGTTNKTSPVQVLKMSDDNQNLTNLTNVVEVAAGFASSYALDGNGKVWAWGSNANGRVGNGVTAGSQLYATAVTKNTAGNPQLSEIQMIAAGDETALALTESGEVWGWGFNTNGQLAQGTTTTSETRAVKLKLDASTEISGVTSLAAGMNHTAMVRWEGSEQGTVLSAGQRNYGQLGNNSTLNGNVSYPVHAVKVDNTALTGIVQVACGPRHTVALDKSGFVWTWGLNNRGQLGDGTTNNRGYADMVRLPDGSPLENVAWVAAGGYIVTSGGTTSSFSYSMAVLEDGRIFVWGANNTGQFGNGNTQNNNVYAIQAAGGMFTGNRPPVISLGVTGGGGYAPSTLTLTAAASDPDGAIDRVDFYQEGIFLGSKSTPPYIFQIQDAPAGSYSFRALAWDDQGAFADSDIIPATLNTMEVSVASHVNSVGENSSSPGVFRFTRTAAVNSPLTIYYSVGGNATSGSDYVALSGMVIIPANQSHVDLEVVPIPDDLEEGNEGVTVTLQANSTYTIGTSQATVVIQDQAPASSPILTILSGNHQKGLPGDCLAGALEVELRSGTGSNAPIVNAPVTFSVTAGGGGLSGEYGSETTHTTLVVETDSEGIARVWHKQGGQEAATGMVDVSGPWSSSVQFSSTTSMEDGLWSHWAFNENVGTLAEEETGLTADGTLTNGATREPGFDGQSAVSFSTSQSHITMGIPADGALDPDGNDFTIAFWAKYTETAGAGEFRRIVSKGFEGWGSGFFVGVDGEGKLAVGLGGPEEVAGQSLLFKTQQTFNTGQWHHVAVIFDRKQTAAQIYVDGVSRALEKEPGTGGSIDPQNPKNLDFGSLGNLDPNSSTTAFTVSSHSGTTDFFVGAVDDLRIHLAALDTGAVASIRNLDSDQNGLPDWWEMKHFGQLGIFPQADADADGLTNLQEYQQGRHPLIADYNGGSSGFYYASKAIGHDAYDGLSSVVTASGSGPKATIQSALATATNGDTIILLPGQTAFEEGSLNPLGKTLRIRPGGTVRIK